jgi:uncharacterized protein (DUF2141 family)
VLNIIAEPISADILDQYVLKVSIENIGEDEVKDLSVSVDKWSPMTETIDRILPSITEDKKFILSLPETPGEDSLGIKVLQGDVLVASKSVPVSLAVPKFSLKLNKDPETGRLYQTVIVDNMNNTGKQVEVEFSVNKEKETYILDTDRVYDVEENKVFHNVDFLSQKLPAGTYEVDSMFYENGTRVAKATSFVVLEGGKKGFNTQYIFYALFVILVGFSLYIFFASQKKIKGMS